MIPFYDPQEPRMSSMYIKTLLSDRFRPSWSTHTATCHIGVLS